MKETLRLIFTLTLFCLIAGGLLAGVDALTRDRIAEANRARRLAALKAVLPNHDNQPDTEVIRVEHDGVSWDFSIARLDGNFTATAVETVSTEGYAGEVRLMLGMTADAQTVGIAILEQKETPGLGANITTPSFRKQFSGRDIVATDWSLTKEGGDIDHITAATISSRAVVDAVSRAVNAFIAHKETISNGVTP